MKTLIVTLISFVLCFPFLNGGLPRLPREILGISRDDTTEEPLDWSEADLDILDEDVGGDGASLADRLRVLIRGAESKENTEDPSINASTETLEAVPSAIIAGCVNVMTGSYFDSGVDLPLPGPQPVVVQHTFCNLSEFYFSHLPALQVGRSRHNKHAVAAYIDDNGSGFPYKAQLKGNTPEKGMMQLTATARKHLNNFSGGEISGKTRLSNSRLQFIRRGKDKLYRLRGQLVRQVTKTDPLGRQEISIYDTQGHVVLFECRNPFGEKVQSEQKFYDAAGQHIRTVATVFDGKSPTRAVINEWEYDTMGHMIHCTEAKGASEEKHTRINYNAFGQKEQLIKPEGVILNHTYDLLGRLTRLRASDGSIDCVTTYDASDNPILVEDHVNVSANKRSYDSHNRLIAETLDTGLTLAYSHDPCPL